MVDLKSFYTGYQYDYYVYKLMTLIRIIENVDEFEKQFFKGHVYGYSKQDYLRSLKSDLRQTFYHSIETIFELIFALEPNKNGKLDDRRVLLKLTKSDWKENYRRVSKIANDENGLDFLKVNLTVKGHEISVAQYIFYFGILPDNKSLSKEQLDLINPSIEAILLGLKIIAQEFEGKKEYNSYKHGLRLIPVMKSFFILNAETKEKVMDWDLSDSMTFINLTKNVNEIEFVTKLFDIKRDLGLAMFCSNLISNVILLRKAAFNLLKEDEKFPVLFFDKEAISKISAPNVKIQDFKHKITKKNEP